MAVADRGRGRMNGDRIERIRSLAEAAPQGDLASGAENPKSQGSQADRLFGLAKARYRLGISTEGHPFAVKRSGPNVALLLRHVSGSLRSELAAWSWRTPTAKSSLYFRPWRSGRNPAG